MCENFISTPRALKLSINLLRDCQNHVSERSLLIIPVTFNDGSTNGPFICSIIGDTIPSRDQQLQDWLLYYIKVKWVLLVCLIDSVQQKNNPLLFYFLRRLFYKTNLHSLYLYYPKQINNMYCDLCRLRTHSQSRISFRRQQYIGSNIQFRKPICHQKF